MRVTVPHNTDKETARRKINERLGQIFAQYGHYLSESNHKWEGDRLVFSGVVKGFKANGSVQITDSEVIIDGKYYWVPFLRVRSIRTEPPQDLRDLVWTAAQFVWANGGESPGFIPTRYPGTEKAADNSLRLARKTEWIDQGNDLHFGLGQRMLATDQSEIALTEVRQIELSQP